MLNTSTSNGGYQTAVDISNLGLIEYDDATGKVKIPAGTLIVRFVYSDNNRAIRTLIPQVYNEAITFTLSNYFSKLTSELIEQMPFDKDENVNNRFKTESVASIKATFADLLVKAKKLYTSTAASPLSAAETKDAQDAINILKFRFLSPVYYDIPGVEKYLLQPFKNEDVTDKTKANQYTQFDNLTFSEEKYIEGSVKIKVSVKNYITGFSAGGYTLGDKVKEFSLSGVLGQLLSPT